MRNQDRINETNRSVTYGGAEYRLDFEGKNAGRKRNLRRKLIAVVVAAVFVLSGVLIYVVFRKSLTRIENRSGSQAGSDSVKSIVAPARE